MASTLRPMDTSEVLDRTFSLYRDNFPLFAGIAVLPALVALASQFILLQPNITPVFNPGKPPDPSALVLFFAAWLLVLVPLYMLGHALAGGATIFAVSHFHLGRTTTAGEAYQRTLHSFARILGIVVSSLFLFWVAIVVTEVAVGVLVGVGVFLFRPVIGGGHAGPGLIAGAIFLGLVAVALIVAGLGLSIRLYLRLSLSVPACLVENTGVFDSMKRSWFLAKGSVNRIFLIYLLLGILGAALSWALQIPAFVLMSKYPPLFSKVWAISATFVATLLASPVSTIAIALVYFDQRVRKEAFDLQLMMQSIEGTVPSQSAAAYPGMG